MSTCRQLVDILTDEEKMAWHDRDHVEFYEWYARWFRVELEYATRGIKLPKHRYNKKYPHMP